MSIQSAAAPLRVGSDRVPPHLERVAEEREHGVADGRHERADQRAEHEPTVAAAHHEPHRRAEGTSGPQQDDVGVAPEGERAEHTEHARRAGPTAREHDRAGDRRFEDVAPAVERRGE